MEKKQLKDDFLGKLLKASQTEKPGFDFTAKVMNDIHKLEVENARISFWTIGNILMILAGVAALVLFYFIVSPFYSDLSLFDQGIEPERFNRYIDWILSFFKSFVALLEFVRNSTLTLIILFVIPSLLVFDRVLKHLTSRTFLFLI